MRSHVSKQDTNNPNILRRYSPLFNKVKKILKKRERISFYYSQKSQKEKIIPWDRRKLKIKLGPENAFWGQRRVLKVRRNVEDLILLKMAPAEYRKFEKKMVDVENKAQEGENIKKPLFESKIWRHTLHLT